MGLHVLTFGFDRSSNEQDRSIGSSSMIPVIYKSTASGT